MRNNRAYIDNDDHMMIETCCMYRLVSNYQLNAQFLYSMTIYMLHYNPRHVSVEIGLCRVCSQPAYCTAVYREWW